MLDSWRFLQQDSGFQLYGYVILENYLHLIAASEDLSHDIQRFKSYTAKQIIAHLEQCHSAKLLELLAFFKRTHKQDTTYQVWEAGSHPQIIESEVVMRQKLDYIHQNPVKRDYVDQPEHWRYSSARNYAGQAGLIEVIRAWCVTREAGASKTAFPSWSLGTSPLLVFCAGRRSRLGLN